MLEKKENAINIQNYVIVITKKTPPSIYYDDILVLHLRLIHFINIDKRFTKEPDPQRCVDSTRIVCKK